MNCGKIRFVGSLFEITSKSDELNEREKLDLIIEDDIYPNCPKILKNGETFSLFGRFDWNKIKDSTSVKAILSFEKQKMLGNDKNEIITQEFNFTIEPKPKKSSEDEIEIEKEFGIIEYLWATQKMEFLSSFSEENKKELKELGEKYSIVTPSTSLIVLQTLQQYLKHDITPSKS